MKKEFPNFKFRNANIPQIQTFKHFKGVLYDSFILEENC